MNILSNSSLSLKERLTELGKIQNNQALISQVFGLENKNAALQLIQNTNLLDQYTTAVNENGVAANMANTIMDTTAAKTARLQAKIKDALVDVGSKVKNITPYLTFGLQATQAFQSLSYGATSAIGGIQSFNKWLFIGKEGSASLATQMFTTAKSAVITAAQWVYSSVVGIGRYILSLQWLKKETYQAAWSAVASSTMAAGAWVKNGVVMAGASIRSAARMVASSAVAAWAWVTSMFTMTGATAAFNVVLAANPIGAFIVGIMAIVGVGYLIYKQWDNIVAFFKKVGAILLKYHPFMWLINLVDVILPGFKAKIGELFDWVVNKMKALWGGIKQVWEFISGLFNTDSKVSMDLNNTITTTDENGNPKTLNASEQASSINKVDGNVEGNGVRSVIVNIGNIISNISGSQGLKLTERELKEFVAKAIVDAVRDAEIILG